MILFFFNDTATTEIYTLSLHDALPICSLSVADSLSRMEFGLFNVHVDSCCRTRILVYMSKSSNLLGSSSVPKGLRPGALDRKSTRLNSSHANISYAVFCLKKKIYYY